MILVVAPDGLVDRKDRALWLTPPFDRAFLTPTPETPAPIVVGAQSAESQPDDYAETPDGKLLIADGLNPVKIWDGLIAVPIDAGLAAPGTAPTLGKSATAGPIYGDYQAYVRFLDAEGNPSNLSPISTSLSARNAALVLTDASNTVPIVITKTAHGLTTGTVVEIAGVQGNEAANGIWAITSINANTFSLDDSNGDGTYTTGGTVTPGTHQVNYTNVPIPLTTKAVRKQILRNTNGQLTTFYVDVDTTSVSTTSFNSTRDDNQLAAQVAVPLLGVDGQILADANDLPPNFMRCLAHHLGRMFALVNAVYTTGNVAVTNGQSLVTGIGTNWTTALAGRFLYALGATRSYEIASVDTTAQTLTLTEAFTDTTSAYASYAIRPAPAYRRQVWYSRAGFPESWSPTYALSIQDNGDELTGVLVKGSFIYFLEKAHINRLTFQNDPAIDGHIYSAGERGCINNRCWVQVEDKAYMLDEKGVHAFIGGDESEAVSMPIHSYFDFNDGFFSINWKASDLFHAVHSPHEEAVRWFVSMGSCTQPRHAIVFHYRLERWSVEEYARPILSSCLGWESGVKRVFLGSDAMATFAHGKGNLDGIDPDAGTLAGTATAASVCTLTDGHASFPVGLAGLPVSIVKGPGQGQQRMIHAATATVLSLDAPWNILPTAQSVYQIGGIRWEMLTKTFEWAETDREVQRRFAVSFKPAAGWFHFQMYLDGSDVPVEMAASTDGEMYEGSGSSAFLPRLAISQARKEGFAQLRLAGRRDINFDGPREVTFKVHGVSGRDGFQATKITVDGAE